jgi:peroxiredoxin
MNTFIKSISLLCLVFSLFSASTIKVDDIPQKPEDISPLLIGEAIPKNIHLVTHEGKALDLNQTVQSKPTILIFYRGGWCPYCNKQLSGIGEIEQELISLGYQIIAISPDKPEELKKTIDKNKLSYTLLSDSKMIAAIQFGIAFKNTTYAAEKLEKASGERHNLLPVPAVFVLDKKGTIKFEYINPNIIERLHPSLLLAAARIEMESDK